VTGVQTCALPILPVWYVAPLEMNECTHLGQEYNRSIKAAVPKKGTISDL
jgi:hypothetical protein